MDSLSQALVQRTQRELEEVWPNPHKAGNQDMVTETTPELESSEIMQESFESVGSGESVSAPDTVGKERLWHSHGP